MRHLLHNKTIIDASIEIISNIRLWLINNNISGN